ncbi:peptidase associated/transthyretin-like domain-containing protein [Flavobacterium frigoris]|uniref:CarboxypepD_reg-like domain-containing protein n=1 Tax=Flavobacterium frigoris TaxID=229204 RepID=A0A1H9FRS0_FLAFI|nr:hypothetical protein [Flavobacterium frigoris]SEQ40183.1 hypothetical protein SAMN05444355_102261 [Flavobacterium frigoris]
MVRLRFLFLLVFTTAAVAHGSVSPELKGMVNGDGFNVDGIYIINLATEKAAITDGEGYFVIPGLAGDTLLFSSVQYKSRRIVLMEEDFAKGLFFVKMTPIMNQLNEVVIRRYDNINAVSLGIIPENQISYTPAERKYATASSGKMNPMGFDPLINFLSGRTAMLKKEMKVEKKEFFIKELESMFDRSHFVDKLKIPADYVKGFEYYAVDNDRFTVILESKNKVITEFLLGELAVKYNEIIACENE